MECDFNINALDGPSIIPSIQFKLIQLNYSAICFTNSEIDFQVDQLIRNAEMMRKKAKKKLTTLNASK